MGQHDHANFIDSVGLGEIVAMLNGVKFRTRHNDYRLLMKASSNEFGATTPIEMPNVPPEVRLGLFTFGFFFCLFLFSTTRI